MNFIPIFQSIDFSRYIFFKISDIMRLYPNFFLIIKVIDVHSRKYEELEKYQSLVISTIIYRKLLFFPYVYYVSCIFLSFSFFCFIEQNDIIHIITKTDIKRDLLKIPFVFLPGLFTLKYKNKVSLRSDIISFMCKAVRIRSQKQNLIISSSC